MGLLAERDKLTALGQLAGGVAHEINNLLQPALIFPEFVRDNLPPDDLKSREYLAITMDSIRKAGEIVRNVLLFARKEQAHLETVDLASEIADALNFIRNLLPPGISIQRNFKISSVLVAINVDELTQVIANLVINAVHATGADGSIEVGLEHAEPSAAQVEQLGLAARTPYAMVTVTDTGSGMDAATVAHIFEPFFTTKPLGVGTGLGLSVVQGIMRSWNGRIGVESKLGYGTTFTLFIPVATINRSYDQ
jgi:signal transduction histidine kinase